MDFTFEVLKKTRQNFLNLVSNLTIEDVNTIPANFNNNIQWNLAHIVAAQQVLCYKFSGNDFHTDLVAKYGRGTKPEGPITAEEFENIKSLVTSSQDKLIMDYGNGLFETYTPYTASYGVVLASIEDAIKFVTVHEGMHYGCAIALKKAIGKF